MQYIKKSQRKTSIGVAICRRAPTTNVPQLLLVKSRVTYNFCSFVFGKYKPWDRDKLVFRFCNMTNHEKILIWSFDFEAMWTHIWLKVPVPTTEDTFFAFYINCKTKFERLISRDNGRRLRGLLNLPMNTSIELGWEIPKGRQESSETEIECAVREIAEETGVTTADYNILTDVTPICTSYEDDNTTYVCKYFVGYTDKIFTPILDYNNINQISEISAIGWFGLQQINELVAQGPDLQRQAKLALSLFKSGKP